MAEKERINKAIATSLHMQHLIYESSAEGITANPGGGQANSVPLTNQISRVTTVTTTGDSVGLIPSVPGLYFTLINAGSNTLDVYPASGDQINALGANAAFTVAATKVVTFFCTLQGQWHSQTGA